MLLSRDEFRKQVFKRDDYQCIWCGEEDVDAHHLMERRLFIDVNELGGYFINNGVSLCSRCHLKAESTAISPYELASAAGIKQIVLPEHFYKDQKYDKWGNPELKNGKRMKGELFYDESVQRAIGPFLHLYIDYVKYPRTYHLPWSFGKNDDDKNHTSYKQWESKEVVVTIKMDGENTTMYNRYIHTRSIDGRNHVSRSWVKNFYFNNILGEIPDGYRLCGENLYAKHSIAYENLDSYFYGFSIWDNKNFCLDWDTNSEWFKLLGVRPVDTLYRGVFNLDKISKLHKSLDFNKHEGYVLRTVDGFYYKDFSRLVGKFVRPHHIQTIKHWMHGQPLEKNGLTKA